MALLSQSQTVARFIIPIVDSDLLNLGSLQRFLLKAAVVTPNDSLAATRLLALLTDTDIYALMLESTFPVTISVLNDAQKAELISLQELLNQFEPFDDAVRIALREAKKFLPKFTTDFINNYNTLGAPLERLTTTVFMILTANLQD